MNEINARCASMKEQILELISNNCKENDLSGVRELVEVNIFERLVSPYVNPLVVVRGRSGVSLYLNAHSIN